MSELPYEVLRPPIGFVVEGHGEFNCYPSLVHRIVGARGFKIPRVNAGGYGNLVRNLGDQLRALVLADHPSNIIVTVDLRDVIRENLYATCAELVSAMNQQAAEWYAQASSDGRMTPMPNRITVVVQVQEFESWILADLQSVTNCGYALHEQHDFSNVDEEVPNPSTWLLNQVEPAINLKNPRLAKSIVTQLNVDEMRKNSPSFDKFHREVMASYGNWSAAAGWGWNSR